MLRKCKCGCETIIPRFDKKGRARYYAHGHNHRGKSNHWKIKDAVGKRTSHERAVNIKQAVLSCEWLHIGDCRGPLDVAHADGDHFNNDPLNLIKLCRSHHRLMDAGRIDPKHPVMPAYVVISGKRRYLNPDGTYRHSNKVKAYEQHKGSPDKKVLKVAAKEPRSRAR